MKILNFRSKNNKCKLMWSNENTLDILIGNRKFSFLSNDLTSIFFSEMRRDHHHIVKLHVMGLQNELLEVEISYRTALEIYEWFDSIHPLSLILGKCPIPAPSKNKRKARLVSLLLLALLLFLITFGVIKIIQKIMNPKSQDVKTEQSVSENTSFNSLLDEGIKLIEENHLSAGIEKLLDAKKIDTNPELESILNQAYFERGEYYFQNNEFEKALRDFENMIVLTPAAQEMMTQMKISSSSCINDVSVESLQSLLIESYYLTFQEPKKLSSGNWVIDGSMFDDDTKTTLSCRLYIKNPQEIYRIIFETNATDANPKPEDHNFEKLSANYLGFAATLFQTDSDPVKASEWIVKTVPKAKLSYVQFDNIFVNMNFRLYGEQYKRVLEISPTL